MLGGRHPSPEECGKRQAPRDRTVTDDTHFPEDDGSCGVRRSLISNWEDDIADVVVCAQGGTCDPQAADIASGDGSSA